MKNFSAPCPWPPRSPTQTHTLHLPPVQMCLSLDLMVRNYGFIHLFGAGAALRSRNTCFLHSVHSWLPAQLFKRRQNDTQKKSRQVTSCNSFFLDVDSLRSALESLQSCQSTLTFLLYMARSPPFTLIAAAWRTLMEPPTGCVSSALLPPTRHSLIVLPTVAAATAPAKK